MLKNAEKRKYILAVIFVLGILLVTLPVVCSSGYTYLCEDDFSFECGAKDAFNDYGSSVIGAASRTWNYYLTNQGTYLFTFLVHFIRAYSRGGLVGFNIYMVFNSVLFVLSLLNLLRLLIKDRVVWFGTSFAAFLMIFGMSGTIAGVELFFWYTGTLNFTLELSLSFIAISLLVTYLRNNKRAYLICSCIFSFFASGGSLNIVAANCAFLVTLLFFLVWQKKFRKDALFPFGTAFIGAVINAVAPGNFIRSTEPLVEGHATFFDAIRDTFVMQMYEERVFLGNLIFILAMLLIFILCVFFRLKFIEGGVSLPLMLISFVGTGVIRYLTLFPVAYGYHTELMSNMRTTSSYETVAKLTYALFAIIFSQFVWELCEKEKAEGKSVVTPARVSLAVVFLMAVISFAGFGKLKLEYTDSISYKALHDLVTGAKQETFAVRKYCLDSFAAAEDGTDVILNIEPFNMAMSSYGMGIAEDSEWFVNKSAADLFDLNSVTILYSD